ncbi:hypothetical protein [Sphingomonas koreensis]|uniref:hypothetical protein n=2 Tax=Sphingomonas koreensis TaxID=93064 RepID=UPI000F7357B9|nr:hypothetical protein [Sphingomonas koreensis]
MPQPLLSPRDRMVAALRREQAALDELIAETELGPRNQGHFDALEERAQSIGSNIVGAFRRPQPGPKVTPGRNGGVWV